MARNHEIHFSVPANPLGGLGRLFGGKKVVHEIGELGSMVDALEVILNERAARQVRSNITFSDIAGDPARLMNALSGIGPVIMQENLPDETSDEPGILPEQSQDEPERTINPYEAFMLGSTAGIRTQLLQRRRFEEASVLSTPENQEVDLPFQLYRDDPITKGEFDMNGIYRPASGERNNKFNQVERTSRKDYSSLPQEAQFGILVDMLRNQKVPNPDNFSPQVIDKLDKFIRQRKGVSVSAEPPTTQSSSAQTKVLPLDATTYNTDNESPLPRETKERVRRPANPRARRSVTLLALTAMGVGVAIPTYNALEPVIYGATKAVCQLALPLCGLAQGQQDGIKSNIADLNIPYLSETMQVPEGGKR